MGANWLVKMAEKQPTDQARLQQAVEELPAEDLLELAREAHVSDEAAQYHDFLEKAAMADQMGRELARKYGGSVLPEKTAMIPGLASIVSGTGAALGKKALGWAAANPTKALGIGGAAIGAASGAAGAQPGSRISGALKGGVVGGGAGLGLGALGNKAGVIPKPAGGL